MWLESDFAFVFLEPLHSLLPGLCPGIFYFYFILFIYLFFWKGSVTHGT